MIKVERRGKFDIEGKRAKIKKLKSTLPKLLTNQAKNHFLEGFRRGGKQTDNSRGGWRPRKNRKTTGRAILVKSGDLKADIRVRETAFSKSIVGTRNIPYARRHNEGLYGMPQREFIGNSRALDKKAVKLIERALK